MRLRRLLLILGLLWPMSAGAADSLTFGHLNTAQLEAIFDYYDYTGMRGYLSIPEHQYPPLFFQYFPDDFATVADEKKRNELFIKILAPLTLRLNNEILDERRSIQLAAKNFETTGELTPEQEKFVEEKAAKYDIFTRFKGHRRYKYLFSELLRRVHVVLPSLLITAAALETNWGTSRIVKDGNSLYKTLVWHTDDGLKPIGETEDDTYRIKTYPNIYASMQEFAIKLNSHIGFEPLRNLRNEILRRRTPLLGSTLAANMVWNSPLYNYAGLFDYTLSYYELNTIDKSVLNSKMIERPLPPDLQKLTI